MGLDLESVPAEQNITTDTCYYRDNICSFSNLIGYSLLFGKNFIRLILLSANIYGIVLNSL